MRLPASREAAASSRAFVEPLVRSWNGAPLEFEVALVTSELVTNAVLHAQSAIVLALRPIEGGVRIEVTDSCPSVLPHTPPQHADLPRVMTLGQSGRGLQVVCELAARWGIDTTQRTKTVWAELSEGKSGPTEPLLQLEYEAEVRDGVTLRYIDLPTATAVASGVQVDDVVRAIQLEHGATHPEDAAVGRLYQLLLSTAAERLEGRHAALWASAEDQPTFDFEVITTVEAMRDLGELSRMLENPDAFISIAPPKPPGELTPFRRWLQNETARQLRGEAPRSYGSDLS